VVEFIVLDEPFYSDEFCYLAGRCSHSATRTDLEAVKVGSIFRFAIPYWLDRETDRMVYGVPLPIHLVVKRIMVFGQDWPVLDLGIGGLLILSGDGSKMHDRLLIRGYGEMGPDQLLEIVRQSE
jgi:hypothetical protein